MAIDDNVVKQFPRVLHFEQESQDGDSEAIQAHFDRAPLRHTNDLGWEAARVMGMLNGEALEEDSPVHDLIFAIAWQSKKMAYRAIGEATGLDSDALQGVIDVWESLKLAGKNPAPINIAALPGDVASMKKNYEETDEHFLHVPPLNLSFHKETD